jgi:F5/8 type C domain
VASSLEGTTYAASKAFDGNTSTRWSSQFADPQWVYVDLGAAYNVDRVKLVWEAASSKAYLVQVSLDATNWTTIYSTATSTGGIQDLTGLAGVGRYVRMYGQSRNTVYGHSLWEMQVYGTAASTTGTVNLALNKAAVASSLEGGTYAASKAFDGNTSTRWSSQFADPQWVYVDLGARYNVSRVKLIWEAAYSTSYKIQVSNDATMWTDIYSTASGKGGTVDLSSVTGVGRYVRMYGSARGTVYGHSLWEMEVYGTAGQ